MAQAGTNNDLLNKRELDKEAQELAAGILKQGKGRIKKVKVKITEEVKSKTGEPVRGAGAEPGEKGGKEREPEEAGRKEEPRGKGKEGEDGESGGSGGGEPGGEAGEDRPSSAEATEDKPGQKPEAGGQEGTGEGLGQADQGGAGAGEGAGGKSGEGEKPREESGEAGKKGGQPAEEKPGEKELGEPQTTSKGAGEGEEGSGGKGRSGQEGLDSRLLNPEQEGEAAEKLRRDKMGGEKEEDEGPGAPGRLPKYFREIQARARQVQNNKEKLKKLGEKAAAPLKQALSKLLKQAWLNLIDSFGLTLIWINIHVFFKWVLGEKLFCKLGEEWLPEQGQQVMQASPLAGSPAGQGGEASGPASRSIGLAETVALLILDLIVLAVILAVLALIVMIIDFMQASWWEKFKLFVGGLTNLDWSSIKALLQLF